MPYFPIVGDIVEQKTACAFSGQNGLNVRHWRVTFIISGGANLKELADNHSGILSNMYKAYLPDHATFRGVQMQQIFPLPAHDREVSNSGNGFGTREEEPLPSQATQIWKLTSGFAGRANRGRLYLPFWTEADNDSNGQVSVAATALGKDIADFFTTSQTTVGAGGSTTLLPVVFHRADGTDRQLTGNEARQNWATQRRRSLINRADTLIPVVV